MKFIKNKLSKNVSLSYIINKEKVIFYRFKRILILHSQVYIVAKSAQWFETAVLRQNENMDASEQNESEVHQIDSDDVIQEEDETEKEEGEDLTEDAEALKAELAKIVVHPPSYEV